MATRRHTAPVPRIPPAPRAQVTKPLPQFDSQVAPKADVLITTAQVEAAIQRLRRRPIDIGPYGAALDLYDRQRQLLMALYRNLVTQRLGGVTSNEIPPEARAALQLVGSPLSGETR